LCPQTGEFSWDEETQGHVLAAYYYGYVATQLMGGRLSETLGAKTVYGTGIMLSGIFTLLGPVSARANFYAFIAIRVLTGAASVGPNIQEVGMSRITGGVEKYT
jgi:MFS family permease